MSFLAIYSICVFTCLMPNEYCFMTLADLSTRQNCVLTALFVCVLLLFKERSQSGKQRNTGSKRGDKRNFKVPLKIKNDYLRGWPSISSLSTAGSVAPGMTL